MAGRELSADVREASSGPNKIDIVSWINCGNPLQGMNQREVSPAGERGPSGSRKSPYLVAASVAKAKTVAALTSAVSST